MRAMTTVLVVDDQPDIVRLVRDYLERGGFLVLTAADGEQALQVARRSHPDLVILDLSLPGLDGLDVARALRRDGDVPIIMLTARTEESDRVAGLELGADDYVTKPFSAREMVARVRAVLRRASRTSGTGDQAGAAAGPLRAGDIELDEDRWTVHRAGVPVELSPTEFRLLAYLMRHQGRVLTRAQLLESVWGWDYAGESQIVETYVSYLRRKLDPLGPPVIYTQRGVGYSLRPQDRGRAGPG